MMWVRFCNKSWAKDAMRMSGGLKWKKATSASHFVRYLLFSSDPLLALSENPSSCLEPVTWRVDGWDMMQELHFVMIWLFPSKMVNKNLNLVFNVVKITSLVVATKPNFHGGDWHHVDRCGFLIKPMRDIKNLSIFLFRFHKNILRHEKKVDNEAGQPAW